MRGQELQRAAVLHPRAALRVRRGRLRRPGGRGRPRRARRVSGRAGVRLQQLQEVRLLLPRQGRLLRPLARRGAGPGPALGRAVDQLEQLGRVQHQLWRGGEGADPVLRGAGVPPHPGPPGDPLHGPPLLREPVLQLPQPRHHRRLLLHQHRLQPLRILQVLRQPHLQLQLRRRQLQAGRMEPWLQLEMVTVRAIQTPHNTRLLVL